VASPAAMGCGSFDRNTPLPFLAATADLVEVGHGQRAPAKGHAASLQHGRRGFEVLLEHLLCTGHSHELPVSICSQPCVAGAGVGVWVGVLLITSASTGLAVASASRSSPNRCWLMRSAARAYTRQSSASLRRPPASQRYTRRPCTTFKRLVSAVSCLGSSSWQI